MILCRFVWMIKCLSIFLVPIPKFQHAPLPQSVVSQGACPDSLLFQCFTSYSYLNLLRSLRVRQVKFRTYYFTTKKKTYNYFQVTSCWFRGGWTANMFRWDGRWKKTSNNNYIRQVKRNYFWIRSRLDN